MTIHQKKQLPELLAPAGNLETALAAYDAGADAVYCGMGRFNARERAENFTSQNLGRLLNFAHERNRKLYLTVNTLVKEQELPSLMELLAELAELSPDALIVQDPALIELTRRYFPSLRLHASTQMGIHNSAGIALAAALGFERVILERQVTLAELESMAKRSPVELEVFLHGSLCCSLSGRCLLSASQGGWSGNRGKCKQPCRRTFETAQGRGYQLSPRDLYGVDLLPEFRRMGIASLKIEGRLRSPDYVWKTVRAYRMLLDAPPETPPEVRAEAEQLLRSTATRLPSPGFYRLKKGGGGLIDPERLGVFGNVVGKVEKACRAGLLVMTSERLHLGDRLRLVPPDGGDGASFSLIRLEQNDRPAVKVRADSRCFLPGEFNAAPGYWLYKIGENGFDYSRLAAALPEPRCGVRLTLRLSSTHWVAQLAELPGKSWEVETAFAAAERRPISAERIQEEFATGVPAPWRAETISVTLEGSFFVPASELKELRRSFWQWAAERLGNEPVKPSEPAQALSQFYFDYQAQLPAPATELNDVAAVTVPAFVAEGRLPEIRRALREAYDSGIRRYIVTMYHAIALVRELPSDVEMIAAFPLPVANSQAAKLLASLGVTAAETEPELSADDLAALTARSPLPSVPIHAEADLPLLVSRARLASGQWRDTKNRVFHTRYDAQEQLWKLYADHDVRREFRDSEWL